MYIYQFLLPVLLINTKGFLWWNYNKDMGTIKNGTSNIITDDKKNKNDLKSIELDKIDDIYIKPIIKLLFFCKN